MSPERAGVSRFAVLRLPLNSNVSDLRMHALLRSLSGGDRRSVGESNRAAALILEQPELIAVLFQGLDSTDPVLRMRCSDAIEKATAKRPELLAPYKKALMQRYSKIEQQEVRWHVAPLLSRLPLTTHEATAVVKLLLSFTNDRSSIVRTMTMQRRRARQ